MDDDDEVDLRFWRLRRCQLAVGTVWGPDVSNRLSSYRDDDDDHDDNDNDGDDGNDDDDHDDHDDDHDDDDGDDDDDGVHLGKVAS